MKRMIRAESLTNMARVLKLLGTLAAVAVVGIAFAQPGGILTAILPTGTLTAILVDQAPSIDGVADEPFWEQAQSLTFEAAEEFAGWRADNQSATTVTIRAAHNGEEVFFLLQWADPTYSRDRQRWQFDGQTWTKMDQTPLRQGGARTNYEDKLAFLWNINDSIAGFNEAGPVVMFQPDLPNYDRPVKATNSENERADMWHWKLVRTNFTQPSQVDDQYVDADKESKNAGRHPDPGEGGYYSNEIELNGVKLPKYMFAPGQGDGFIMTQAMIDRGEVIEITDYSIFKAGDLLPSIIGRPFTGDRGDLRGKAIWQDGVYTLEIARALVTGSEYDVQFDDLSKTYHFAVATFDNTQIGHAMGPVLKLVFSQ